MVCYHHFNLLMDRSPDFGCNPTNYAPYSDSISLRLRFYPLSLASKINSPVRPARRAPSPINGLWLIVSNKFQILFHSPPGVLFTFPSQYWFTIGDWLVFSLTRWSWQIQTGFHVPRPTQDTVKRTMHFKYGTITLFGWAFQLILLYTIFVTLCRLSYNPNKMLVWALPGSLAATTGIINLFSFPLVTKMFQFTRFASMQLWIHCMITRD